MSITINSPYKFTVSFMVLSPFLNFVCYYAFGSWEVLLILPDKNVNVAHCSTRINCIKFLQWYVNSVWR